MREVELKPGTRGCVVLRGVLEDPYSGVVVAYERSGNRTVQVDHVVSLAMGWDLGASTWSMERRRDFAGDPLNLVVTTAAMNGSKGSKGPAQWRPPTAHGQCLYSSRFLEVLAKYDLPVARSDLEAATKMQDTCKGR